tara:strand:- start:98 stop:2311 length:2214 start_codon:yes stop_codon:yes gene_type:complete
MALEIRDRVKETCTGTSGDMTLTGAVSGFVGFDLDNTLDGDTIYYALEDADGTKWEVGLGTLSADSTSLARTTILATQISFADTTRQTFSGGTHTIFATYPASKAVYLDANGILSASNSMTGLTLTSSNASEPVLHITNTHAGATSGELRFNKDSASGADSDVMGVISFYGTDDSDNTHEKLAYIDSYIVEADHGSEAAGLRFFVAENDATLTQGLAITGQASDDGEVDVTIGAGAASTTTIAGTLTMGSTAALTNAGLVAVANQSGITGLGTIATGTWEATDVAVAHGGTGASTASDARTNLGLVIGTNVQAYDAQLDTLAGLTADQVAGLEDLAALEAPASDGQFIVATGAGAFAYESGATVRTSLGLGSIATLSSIDISANTNLAGGTGITLTGDTLSTTDSEIVHDNLSGFVANEHIDHSSVSVSAGTGLTGGGTIASTRTLSVDINGTADLASPAVADELLISDADDSNTVKKADLASIVNLADHDQLTNFVANEHIDWTASSAGTIHSSNYTDTNTMGSGFVLEDGDGTEVTITENKEVKFVEGAGIDIDWTDVDNGTDADPYDLTFTVSDTTVAGDSGSTGITPGDTLTIAGGTNATTAMSGDTLTVNVDDAFLKNDADDTTSGKITAAGYAISAVVTESGTSRTLADSDNGKVIVCTNGSATTITVPASLATGFAVTVIQTGAGQITFSASSTTINNRQSHTKTAGQHARVGLVQTSSDTYNLGGDTAS